MLVAGDDVFWSFSSSPIIRLAANTIYDVCGNQGDDTAGAGISPMIFQLAVYKIMTLLTGKPLCKAML